MKASSKVTGWSVGLLVAAIILFPMGGSRESRRAALLNHSNNSYPARNTSLSIDTFRSPLEKVGDPAKARMNQVYGKLPLSFEANGGQTDSNVKFIARAGSQTLFLTSTEAVLAVGGSDRRVHPNGANLSKDPYEDHPSSKVAADASVLRMNLVGADRSAKVTGLDELPGKSNYFIGNDPKKWRTNLTNYAKVRYEQVYPGVDLVYYGNQRQLEYDLIVAPGANPRRIKIAFQGARSMRVDEAGDLVLSTAAGEIRQQKPVAYQEMNNVRHEVLARYAMNQNGDVSFEVSAYDMTKRLVIDPVLSYSTFLGGEGFNSAVDVVVDQMGNAYVAGDTGGDFPITPGALSTTRGGDINVFVVKLNPTGSGLVYSSFFGGTRGPLSPIPAHISAALGVAVDPSGNAYVTGYTNTTNFPTTPGCLQNILRGFTCGYVTKLNPEGSALVYSTYLGGSGVGNLSRGIAADSSGNAYVTGFSGSTDFPITAATAFQPAPGGSVDAFLTKLGTSGGLLYSTYLGGANGETGIGVTADDAGNAYVAGATQSIDFPTSPGAFQTFFAGGSDPSVNVGDVFVTKLSTVDSGPNSLIYSTYLGGSGVDGGNGIVVDSSGSAYVTGVTSSLDFPSTQSVFHGALGGKDAFATKLNAMGTHLIYSTHLGGTRDDEGFDIAIDSRGNASVVGYTLSTDLPTVNAIQTKCNCNTFSGDVFVSRLNSLATTLTFSSYLGGTADDMGFGIAVDSSNDIYVSGFARSTNFPTTPGAYQRDAVLDSDAEAFVAKISGLRMFDLCLQDESNGNLLELDPITGEYRFSTCLGITLGGTGSITKKGCLLTLLAVGPDRRLLAQIDTCLKTGSASMQILSQSKTFTIIDRNLTNNACSCSR